MADTAPCSVQDQLTPPTTKHQLPGDRAHHPSSHSSCHLEDVSRQLALGLHDVYGPLLPQQLKVPCSQSRSLEEMSSAHHPFLNVFELERLLYTGKTACNHADEVWPGLYLGDQDMANNRRELRRLGITHVLNASHSRWRGTPEAYEGLGIRYLGVEAHDSPAFDISIHFQTAADFIHRALSQPGGKILVHCAVGVSRSATLVLAYLMLYHHFTLVEAIKKVKDHRGIIPNRGFLRQLLALDRRLRQGLEA